MASKNPLDYVGGNALGKQFRSNPVPKVSQKKYTGPPINIAKVAKRKRKPSEVSDVRSSNPKMGKYKSKGGYAIPFDQDTNKSPYGRSKRNN